MTLPWDHQDEYPSPLGSGPTAINYGYPFQVVGPTTPERAAEARATGIPNPSPPVEYQPPRSPTYDPTYGGLPPDKNTNFNPKMPRDPFNTLHARESETEFSWGEGMYPDPILDYSGRGSRSRFPVADPDVRDQLRNLAALRRTDLSSPFAVADPYVAGNPDRYGAQPPLVRKRGRYKRGHIDIPKPPRMHREW
jgi:hypothetical protein